MIGKKVKNMSDNAIKNRCRGIRRVRLLVHGRVQGVGFRPEMYRRLTGLGCTGHIRNTPEGVRLEIEGREETVRHLIENFSDIIPPRARVDELCISELTPAGGTGFFIEASSPAGESLLPIPPDLATCNECERELSDPGDRRRGYAFNTCTCCGPRFTIATGIPFDRRTSAMESFPLCRECRSEFAAVADRRFHAQTMSCRACGPRLSFFYTGGGKNEPSTAPLAAEEAVDAAARLLEEGGTVAVKGAGGFHLACDASSDRAVGRIRTLKGRPHKPLGVMVEDAETAGCICRLGPGAGKVLGSERAPIVLLGKKDSGLLSGAIAPGLGRIGVMLPYTPLHRVLFDHPRTPPVLVMTSCNRSEEPIAIDSRAVAGRLADMVDGVLDHDRKIENRCDDSVVGMADGAPVVFRRSRGYVPEPVMLAHEAPPILAAGAMWKNTLTLTRGRRAYQSQHIGDVADADNAAFFEETFKRFSALLRIDPEAVACDMHPDYPTTAFAVRLAKERGLPLLRVQHHHAHILSALAEHSRPGPVIGVSMDGTGYGEDGNVWGGEFLVADLKGYRRRFHLKYVPMPGGERAVSEPYRMALSYLADAFGPLEGLKVMEAVAGELPLGRVCALIGRENLSPLSSSCGRLFDAVASLLGIRHRCTYEGQAACELEALAAGDVEGGYPYGLEGGEIAFSETIAGICDDISAGVTPPVISARFHNTVARVVIESCVRLRDEDGLETVALSGGVMQNKYLLERCLEGLHERGFSVLRPAQAPPNDGGISLGQAAHANAKLSVRDGGVPVARDLE